MRFFLVSVISAVAVWLVTLMPLDVVVSGGEQDWIARLVTFLIVGMVMTGANFIIRPAIDLLALPLKILTLGLFSLVVGWFMLWVTAWLSTLVPWVELTIGGFWDTVWAALFISIITGILSLMVPGARRQQP